VEVPVEKAVEKVVEKVVEVPSGGQMEVKEVIKEVPVEVVRIKEVPVEKIVEKIVEVPVEKIVEKRVEVPVYPDGKEAPQPKVEIKEASHITLPPFPPARPSPPLPRSAKDEQ